MRDLRQITISLDWPWLGSRLWLAAQVGAILFLLFCVGVAVVIFLALRIGSHRHGTPDYAGFYAAAIILNERSARELYDPDVQNQVLHTRVPGVPPTVRYPFAHAPILPFLLGPLARLPFAYSYAIWLTILACIAWIALLVCRGFLSWPARYVRPAILLSAALPPLAFEGWLAGQWAIVGLFWISVALRLLEDEKPFASGFALAMCLVKPTLLVFVLPILLVSGRLRLLAGVAVGGLVLGAVCLAIVGIDGLWAYWEMLTGYGRTMSGGAPGFKTFKHVDFHSFFLLLYGSPGWLPKVSLVVIASCFVPFLVAAWWSNAGRTPDGQTLALCATLTGNMLFSPYTPIYDVSLLIPNVLMTGTIIHRRWKADQEQDATVVFLVLVGLLISAAWATQPLARLYDFQPLTLVMLVWACFQMALVFQGVPASKSLDSTMKPPHMPHFQLAYEQRRERRGDGCRTQLPSLNNQ